MCNCCRGGLVDGLPCECLCHEGHVSIWARTRAGKLSAMLATVEAAQFRRDHPNGVVAGQVVTDAGEIEA